MSKPISALKLERVLQKKDDALSVIIEVGGDETDACLRLTAAITRSPNAMRELGRAAAVELRKWAEGIPMVELSSPPECVAALVTIETGFVLLVHSTKGGGRAWELPGGKIEPGETARQAILREVKQETGLDIELADEEPELTEPTERHRGALLFRATAWGLAEPGEGSDVDEAAWFSGDEVKDELDLSELSSKKALLEWAKGERQGFEKSKDQGRPLAGVAETKLQVEIPPGLCSLEILGNLRLRGAVHVKYLGATPMLYVTSAEPGEEGKVHGPFGPLAVYCGPRALEPRELEQLDKDKAEHEERQRREAERKAEAKMWLEEGHKAYTHAVWFDQQETSCGVPLANSPKYVRGDFGDSGIDCPMCETADAIPR